jgi:hypothetical protein
VSATLCGIPAPRAGSAPAPTRSLTPSNGRYRLLAPEMRGGAILRVSVELGSLRSTRLVEVKESADGERSFCDLDGVPVLGMVSWREATRAEAESFRLEQQVSRWADLACNRGAPTLSLALQALSRLERDAALCATADELRERGYDGKASAVLAYRF